MNVQRPISRRQIIHGSWAFRLALACTAFTAALEAAWAANDIWSRRDQFVRIEPQDDRSTPGSDHPVRLDPDAIRRSIGAVKASFEDEAGQLPVFSEEELAVLGEALSEGLARAGPHEDLSFVTIGTHGTGSSGFLGKRLVNTGRVFYRDGRLNLILGEVHADYRKRNVYGQRDQDYRPRRHASRNVAAEGDWQLAIFPGVTRHVAPDGTERPDWILVELPAAAPGSEPLPADTAPARIEAAGEGPTGSVEERLAALKHLRDRELIPEEIYRAKMTEILDGAAAPSADIEQRLIVLKQLRAQGLIPEDAYHSRVEAMLDEL